jgi:hypothetical protein
MKMRLIFFLLLFSAVPIFSSQQVSSTDWTWLHRKTFPENVRTGNAHKKSLLFLYDNISPFTQLVFSWNALRPEIGHFSF